MSKRKLSMKQYQRKLDNGIRQIIRQLRPFAGLTWEFIVLGLYTVYVYIEYLYLIAFPPKPKSLKNETILITGSARGIGRETCIRLARESGGATIICWDLQKAENDKLVEDLKFSGIRAFGYEVDISDRLAVEAAAAQVKREVGDVTILINNAGIMPCHSFLGHNPKEIVRAFEVNVFAHFWILREFLPGMIERNHGHIVTVSSAAGLIPTRNLVPYCGAKHAVCGYVDALKEELRHHPANPNKIRFTTVYPFSCKTNLIENVVCHSRFRSILPITHPETVAKRLIEGIQRNYEHVYVPSAIQVFGTLARILLPKAQAAGADMFVCHVEPKPTEQVLADG